MMVTSPESPLDSVEIEHLRHKLNSADYLYEAIQRIALILSNEFFETSRRGLYHERKKRK
jgi:hypothetical protein